MFSPSRAPSVHRRKDSAGTYDAHGVRDRDKKPTPRGQPSASASQHPIRPGADLDDGRSPTRLPLPSVGALAGVQSREKRRSLLPQWSGIGASQAAYTTSDVDVDNEQAAAGAQQAVEGQARDEAFTTNTDTNEITPGSVDRSGLNGKPLFLKRADQEKNTSMPPPSGLGRTQSIRKPTSIGQPSRSTTVLTHARNASATSGTAASESVARMQSSSSTSTVKQSRPDSSTSSASRKSLSIRSTDVPSQKAYVSRTRTSVEATRHGFSRIENEAGAALSAESIPKSNPSNPVGHRRPMGSRDGVSSLVAGPVLPDGPNFGRSASIATRRAGSTDSGPSKPGVTASNTSRRRQVLQPAAIARDKPLFTTHQQRFSPKKPSQIKPPISSIIAPSIRSTSNAQPGPMDFSLQTELLQLHLLHLHAAEVERDWQLSAKKHLHRKFLNTATAHQRMRSKEREAAERTNLLAIREWTTGTPGHGAAENVQCLAEVLKELTALTEPEGRCTRLVLAFAAWHRRSEEVRKSRNGDDGADDAPDESGLAFVDGLDAAWHSEHAALTRKTSLLSCQFKGLPQPMQGSSLAAIVSACRQLLAGEVEQLRIMPALEAAWLARERAWVEKSLADIAGNIESAVAEIGEPAWRRL
ncbi:hypothetical protein BJ546DRAFT_423502 [Cryomyces antarcticus]